MPSNLDFNPKLLSDVQKLGKFKYKKDAVNAALEEFIQKRRQKEIIGLFGSIDYHSSYDYKAERKVK
ncbi:MAG: type II toxin-antitoxin system VapB family antitoxin [Parachlamydiaceae bacterium]|nr:type II toxin-antitoxin system VapB family antitoxin [Parachlamydiaceae bacterium]